MVGSGASAPGPPLEDDLTRAASAGHDAIELGLPGFRSELERRGPEASIDLPITRSR